MCSNCALRLPSAVTAVHPSGHIRSRQIPTTEEIIDVRRKKYRAETQTQGINLTTTQIPELIIGSMVNVWPAFITPTALFPA